MVAVLVVICVFLAVVLLFLIRKPSAVPKDRDETGADAPAVVNGEEEVEKPASISVSRPLDYPEPTDYGSFFEGDTNNDYDVADDEISMTLLMDYLFSRLDKSISDTVERKLCEQHIFAKPFPEGVTPSKDVSCFVSVKTNGGVVNIEANPGNKVVIDAVTPEDRRKSPARRRSSGEQAPRIDSEIPFREEFIGKEEEIKDEGKVGNDAGVQTEAPGVPAQTASASDSSGSSAGDSLQSEDTAVREAEVNDLPFGIESDGNDNEDGDATGTETVSAPGLPPMPPLPRTVSMSGDPGSPPGGAVDGQSGSDVVSDKSGDDFQNGADSRYRVPDDELFSDSIFFDHGSSGTGGQQEDGGNAGEGEEGAPEEDGTGQEGTDGSVGGPVQSVKPEEAPVAGKEGSTFVVPDEVRYIMEHPEGLEVFCDYVSGRLGMGVEIEVSGKTVDEVLLAKKNIHSVLKGKTSEELCKLLQVYFHTLGTGSVGNSAGNAGSPAEESQREIDEESNMKHILI